MQIRMDDVVVYKGYSDDPDAENSILLAHNAQPVFEHHLDSGEVVLTTAPLKDEPRFGMLHRVEDPDYEDDAHLVVVRV